MRKHFDTLKEAEVWRGEMRGAVARGEVRVESRKTVSEAADEFIAGMVDGTIRSRSRRPYAGSSIAGYETALRKHILPVLGDRRLDSVRLRDTQDLVDQMPGRSGGTVTSASTIANAIDPLRAICRRARKFGDLAGDPFEGIELPLYEKKERRAATIAQVDELIAALPVEWRAFFMLDFYCGYRSGELRGLIVSEIDLAAGMVRARMQWYDVRRPGDVAGRRRLKSKAGERDLPIPAEVRPVLLAHLMATGRHNKPDALVFGKTDDLPYGRPAIRTAALKAWGWKQVYTPTGPIVRDAAGHRRRRMTSSWVPGENALEYFNVHEGRHTFVSTMLAAEAGDSITSAAAGHADTRVTQEYRHTMPGQLADAFRKTQEYRERMRSA
jgi:integrase